MTETYYQQHREHLLEYQKQYNKNKPKYIRRNYDNQYYNNVRKHKTHKEPETFTVIQSDKNLVIEF